MGAENTFDKIVLAVMAVFCVIGGFDRIFGNRLKLGTAFENGIMTMGPLTLSMVGIIVLSPVLAKCLEPVVVPFYSMLGADPLDSNIRIAPTYPCLADLTNAMEIFSLCVKISSVHKYLTDLHQDCPAD